MKYKIPLVTAIIIAVVTGLLVLFITRNFISNLISPPCTGVELRTVKIADAQGEQLKDTVIRLNYECNEVLLNPNIGNTVVLRQYLSDQNFARVETCICPDKLELWRYTGTGDVDAIGIVKNPPPGTGGVGLGLNYSLGSSPDLDLYTGLFSSDNNNPTDTSAPVVKIGVVDTGVDISPPNPPDPQSYLYNFLWTNTQQPCGITPGPFGVNILNGLAPSDLNGHGTHINGIIAGVPPQAGSNLVKALDGTEKRVRLEILNAKFTQDPTSSGNLFQAVCALYYCLEQRVEVINISWGYLSDSIPRIMQPFLKEARDANVVVVAGLGNDGKPLKGPDGTLKFWPAGFSGAYDNVISVGASDNNGIMAPFSNFGDIDIMNVVAPGVLIVSTFPKYLQALPQSGLAAESGTSMATPIVTRTVAIMIGKKKLDHAGYTPAILKTALINHANPNRALGNYVYKHDNVLAVPF